MVYVLLHEGTHIVDFAVGAAPDPTHPNGNHPLVSGIWRDGVTPVDQYRLPILMGNPFRRNGRVIPITHAADLYDALGRTPFISVYASCDSHDDLAELVACTELTMRLHQPYRAALVPGLEELVALTELTGLLHQPYRIIISKGRIVMRVIEPARSNLVQARLKYLSQLTGS
jgi:hypothetical protein